MINFQLRRMLSISSPWRTLEHFKLATQNWLKKGRNGGKTSEWDSTSYVPITSQPASSTAHTTLSIRLPTELNLKFSLESAKKCFKTILKTKKSKITMFKLSLKFNWREIETFLKCSIRAWFLWRSHFEKFASIQYISPSYNLSNNNANEQEWINIEQRF